MTLQIDTKLSYQEDREVLQLSEEAVMVNSVWRKTTPLMRGVRNGPSREASAKATKEISGE